MSFSGPGPNTFLRGPVCATAAGARQAAAVHGLAHQFGTLALDRVLPPGYRGMWEELGERRRRREEREAKVEEIKERTAERAERDRKRYEGLTEVHMAEEIRRAIVEALKTVGTGAAAAEDPQAQLQEASSSTTGSSATGMSARALQRRRLVAVGFLESDVDAALAATDPGPEDMSAAVDWLCLHVDEEELPKGLEARKDVNIVTSVPSAAAAASSSSSSSVVDPEDQPFRDLALRFTDYGLPPARSYAAARVCATIYGTVDRSATLSHLYANLVQGATGAAPHDPLALLEGWARDRHEAKVKKDREAAEAFEFLSGFAEEEEEGGEGPSVESIATSAGVFEWREADIRRERARLAELRKAEGKRLQAKFGREMEIKEPAQDDPDLVWSIRIRPASATGSTVVDFVFPPGCLYPFDRPSVWCRNKTYTPYVMLAASVEAGAAAAAMCGPAVFAEKVLDWITHNITRLANKPFSPVSCQLNGHLGAGAPRGAGEGDEKKNKSKNNQQDKKKKMKEKAGPAGGAPDSWDEDDDEAATAAAVASPPPPPSPSLLLPPPSVVPETTGKKADGDSSRLLADYSARAKSEAFRKMLAVRQSLPAYKQKDGILAAVDGSQVVVIGGETGCGKTTQIPQLLLEAALQRGYGAKANIICTQPRRISATSVAERVADEQAEPIGRSVGYQIRLETKRSAETRLTFCTTGVLLRRLQSDPLLSDVSHVVVDEIHERGVESDFLLVILKSLLRRRRDLRLVLMSATLDASLFSRYFDGCPVISIPGRTFPVADHYLEDVLEAVLPALGPEGPRELLQGHRARGKPSQQDRSAPLPEDELFDDEGGAGAVVGAGQYSAGTREVLSSLAEDSVHHELIEQLVLHISDKHWAEDQGAGAILVFLPGLFDITRLLGKMSSHSQLWVLPLHGTLLSQEQRKVFGHPPKGRRKVILSTNIAETSVTIDDVVYVVDAGRVKEIQYDPARKMSMLLETWIARASAKQRAGRAGRVRPGQCYRLYTRHRFEKVMAPHQVPEMQRTPLEFVCLSIKALGLGRIAEFLALALEPPSQASVASAVDTLVAVGALSLAGGDEALTALGRHLSQLPVDVRIGKMLLYGCMLRCVDPVLTVAAVMSLKSPFVSPPDRRQEANERMRSFAGSWGNSDHLTAVRAYRGWCKAVEEGGKGGGYRFCEQNFLSYSTLSEIADMRRHFAELLSDIQFVTPRVTVHSLERRSRGGQAGDGVAASLDPGYNACSDKQRIVAACLCAGLYPNLVRVRTPELRYQDVSSGAVLAATQSKELRFYLQTREQVWLHPASVNFPQGEYETPWLVYLEKLHTTKVYVRDSTMVSEFALLLFGGAIAVDHEQGVLKIDDWIMFKAPGRIAVLAKEVRRAMDALMDSKIASPESDITASPLMGAVTRLLETNGKI